MPNEVPFLKYELGKGTLISSIVFSCYPNQNKHWHARRIFFFWSGFNKLENFFFFFVRILIILFIMNSTYLAILLKW